MERNYLILLILTMFVLSGCAGSPATSTPAPTLALTPVLAEMRELKNVIRTEVEGVIVRYTRESSWSDNDFSEILENKAEFKSQQIEEFSNTVSVYGNEAVSFELEFDSNRKSTSLECEVTGAISKTKGRYYATLEWLIRPLGLDFIDDHFEETGEGLFWEGHVDGIPTVIEARFPYTGLPYKAWAHPTGHCHAHVWWEL